MFWAREWRKTLGHNTMGNGAKENREKSQVHYAPNTTLVLQCLIMAGSKTTSL